MKLTRFSEKKDHDEVCQFLEYDNEKKAMVHCGDKAVAYAGAGKKKTPLCQHHLEYAMLLYGMGERDIGKE